jgi:glycosyltransferase involved in cell wall biosynthesis
MRVVLLGAESKSLVNFRGDLIKELVLNGYDVTACAPHIDDETLASLEALGARGLSVPLARTGMNPMRDLTNLYPLARVLKTLRPDAIIAYTAKAVIYGALTSRVVDVKRICVLVTGLGYAFTGGPGLKRQIAKLAATNLYRIALSVSNCVVFQNPDDQADFIARGILKPNARTGIVNGSGVDLNHFALRPLPRTPRFLMISRLLGDKGVREYAAAAIAIRAACPNFSCSLVGGFDNSPDAIHPDELARWQAQGLNYEGHLSDVRPAIERAAIVVLPSYREGAPRAVLEAMAMGRAIVTTDVPGCRQAVDHGVNGLLVPARDIDSLRKAMMTLADDPGLVRRMGAESRLRAEKLYEGRAVARETLRHFGLLRDPSRKQSS